MQGHDPLWVQATLALHVAAGSCAFVLAPVALITAKGGKAHRRWGKVYFWAMLGVTISALMMALYRPLLFLGLVAIFSFYSAFVAYRVLGQKAAYKGETVATGLDWAAAAVCFVASALLFLFGAFRPAWVQGLGIPAMVFGGIGMWIPANAAWRFTHRPKDKMFWWYAHLQGMIGSYIAAWTAFLVVTVGPRLGSPWWLWVLPVAIGIPAMYATSAYYRVKFSPRKTAVV